MVLPGKLHFYAIQCVYTIKRKMYFVIIMFTIFHINSTISFSSESIDFIKNNMKLFFQLLNLFFYVHSLTDHGLTQGVFRL